MTKIAYKRYNSNMHKQVLRRLSVGKFGGWKCALMALLLLGGCATQQGLKNNETVEVTVQEWETVKAQIGDQQATIASLRQTVEVLEVVLAGNAKEPQTKVGSVEKLSAEEIDSGAEQDTNEVSGQMSAKAETVADSSHEAMHRYYEGLQLIEERHYENAVQVLRGFVQRDPNHVYVDRATYLIGEARFRNKEFVLALMDTKDFQWQFPYSFMLPAVLYQRGMAFAQLGELNQAQVTFREVIDRFSAHPLAEEASVRLAELHENLKR